MTTVPERERRRRHRGKKAPRKVRRSKVLEMDGNLPDELLLLLSTYEAPAIVLALDLGVTVCDLLTAVKILRREGIDVRCKNSRGPGGRVVYVPRDSWQAVQEVAHRKWDEIYGT